MPEFQANWLKIPELSYADSASMRKLKLPFLRLLPPEIDAPPALKNCLNIALKPESAGC